MLIMLNDIYSDVVLLVRNLKDFVASHPEMLEDMEEFGFLKTLKIAEDLENNVLDVMDRLKEVVYSKSK